MALVELYTTSLCPYCFAAKRLLQQKGIEFTEFDIWVDPEKQKEMLNRANGRKTVPQIFIGGDGIGGYDELAGLDQSGRLDVLLANSTGRVT